MLLNEVFVNYKVRFMSKSNLKNGVLIYKSSIVKPYSNYICLKVLNVNV